MIINSDVLFCCLLTFLFCGLDIFLNKFFKNNYYFVHFLTNIIITFYSINDVISIYIDFDNSLEGEINYLPTQLTYSLHLYHIINYYHKLLYEDWLHHILMCGIALPIANLSNCGKMLNHSLFYLTGIPGGINYLLLFLNRNNYIDKIIQKKTNYYLSLWMRAPGCITHSAFTIILVFKSQMNFIRSLSLIFTAIVTFWNGIYFMDKVVQDYAIKTQKIKN